MAEKFEYSDIIVDRSHPPIGYVTINRPEKRNALTTTPAGTVEQLAQAYREMKDDPEIRVFQVKGAGDCFCSGYDMSNYDQSYWKPREKGWAKGLEKEPWAALSMMGPAKDNPESVFPFIALWWQELWDNPKPSVALVDSFCLGGGMNTAALCDIVYATPEAVFAYPPIRYGASITGFILPPWELGLRRTMDMALTGHFITAQEAYDAGFVTKIVPKDKLEEEGRKVCESIAKVPPMTNYFSKLTVHQYYEGLGIKEWLNYAILTVLLMEQSGLPGHYHDFFENLVFKKGFTEAYKEQRAKWGYPDPVLDKEVARLKAKTKK